MSEFIRFAPGIMLQIAIAVEWRVAGSWAWDSIAIFALYDIYLRATS